MARGEGSTSGETWNSAVATVQATRRTSTVTAPTATSPDRTDRRSDPVITAICSFPRKRGAAEHLEARPVDRVLWALAARWRYLERRLSACQRRRQPARTHPSARG